MPPKGLEVLGEDTWRPGVVPSTDEAEPKPNNASLRFAAWHKPTYLAGALQEGETSSIDLQSIQSAVTLTIRRGLDLP